MEEGGKMVPGDDCSSHPPRSGFTLFLALSRLKHRSLSLHIPHTYINEVLCHRSKLINRMKMVNPHLDRAHNALACIGSCIYISRQSFYSKDLLCTPGSHCGSDKCGMLSNLSSHSSLSKGICKGKLCSPCIRDSANVES